MTKERMEELISNFIDYIAVARNTSEQIEILGKIGFTKDELLDIGYDKEDLEDLEE